MTEGLLRQRRNLIVVSTVLILFDVAKVTIGQVSILGTNLLIGNPKVVYHFLWLLWLYFLVRYAQYLHDEPNLGIRNKYAIKIDSLLNKKILIALEKLNPGHEFSNTNSSNLIRTGLLSWELPLKNYDPSTGSFSTNGVYRIPRMIMLVMKARAIFYVIFVTPRATDYVLPFLLAVLAPAVTFLLPKS